MSEFNKWKQVAHMFGESLAPVGPDGYYSFSPDQWLKWAKDQICVDEIRRLRAEMDRLRRILAALREPSEDVSAAMWRKWGACDPQNHFAATLHALARAAVAAAEQEVGRE